MGPLGGGGDGGGDGGGGTTRRIVGELLVAAVHISSGQMCARMPTATNIAAVAKHIAAVVVTNMGSRAAFFAAQNASQPFLEKANWAVIGDVLNNAKPASRVVSTLKDHQKTVHLINPRDKTSTCHPQLSDVGQPIDVVDLCINHVEGIKQVEQMVPLGISKVFIQPGAESPEILQFCAEKNIEVFQGCVMVEFGAPH